MRYSLPYTRIEIIGGSESSFNFFPFFSLCFNAVGNFHYESDIKNVHLLKFSWEQTQTNEEQKRDWNRYVKWSVSWSVDNSMMMLKWNWQQTVGGEMDRSLVLSNEMELKMEWGRWNFISQSDKRDEERTFKYFLRVIFCNYVEECGNIKTIGGSFGYYVTEKIFFRCKKN